MRRSPTSGFSATPCGATRASSPGRTAWRRHGASSSRSWTRHRWWSPTSRGPGAQPAQTHCFPGTRAGAPPGYTHTRRAEAGAEAGVEALRRRGVEASRRRENNRSAAGQQAEGAFLFEVEGPAWGSGDAAEPAAEIRDGGPDRWFGEHPQAERQRRWTDVVTALEFERGGHGLQVRLAKLPVRWTERAVRNRAHPRELVADLRQEAEILAVAEHASRRAEPPGGLRDTHED